MKVVYVAGPFAAPNAWAITKNIRTAEKLALEVWKVGAAAICPHLNTANFDGVLPRETWLAGDIAILSRCDAMIVTLDWKHSVGTKAEVMYADGHSIPVFFSVKALKEWIDSSAK